MNHGERTVSPAAARPHSVRGRPTPRSRAIIAGLLIILLGAAVMCYPKLTDLRYTWSQWRLAVAAMAADVAAHAGGSDGSGAQRGGEGIALPEGAVALLQIPAIGLEAYVVEGTGGSALAQGPGHYPNTPLPGQPGNAAIAGHRTMYGHPFHDLDLLQESDEIRTGTTKTTAVYRVVQVMVVGPGHTEVVAQTDGDRLTLTTCHPKGSAAQRLVVVAERTN